MQAGNAHVMAQWGRKGRKWEMKLLKPQPCDLETLCKALYSTSDHHTTCHHLPGTPRAAHTACCCTSARARACALACPPLTHCLVAHPHPQHTPPPPHHHHLQRTTTMRLHAAAWSCCAVLLLLAATATTGAHAFTWTACDVDKVPFVPDTVLLNPDPPAAGGQVTFNIQGNAGAGVRASTRWGVVHAAAWGAAPPTQHLLSLAHAHTMRQPAAASTTPLTTRTFPRTTPHGRRTTRPSARRAVGPNLDRRLVCRHAHLRGGGRPVQQDGLPHQDGPPGHQVCPGPAAHRAAGEC